MWRSIKMKTLSKMNVEEAVYTELLREIKDGIWKNGDKLPSETELCRKMQVSRSSVRSAIQRLRALGVVEVIHGKGTYVLNTEEPCLNTHMQTTLNLTEKEFYDMTEFREAIEPNAIRLVVENGTQEGIGYIEKAYLAMRRAAEENDPEEYSRQDCLFHLSILMATGNEAIIQIANIFKDRYYNYFLELNKFLFEENDGNVKALFDPKNASDAHTLIYEYLCKGNSECAQVVMNRIFSNNKQRFQCYLREKQTQREETDEK